MTNYQKSSGVEMEPLIIQGAAWALHAKTVTYDFERLMKAEGDTTVKTVKCSEFAEAVVKHMG